MQINTDLQWTKWEIYSYKYSSETDTRITVHHEISKIKNGQELLWNKQTFTNYYIQVIKCYIVKKAEQEEPVSSF